ncbi:MAG: hypothetical protein AB9856_03025 [Cellulosilyticaceae bacterium]
MEYGKYNYSEVENIFHNDAGAQMLTFSPTESKLNRRWETTPTKSAEAMLKRSIVLDSSVSKALDHSIGEIH